MNNKSYYNMIHEEKIIDDSYKDNYRTNSKNNKFIKEDIIKEFEEYKKELNFKIKKDNIKVKNNFNIYNTNNKSYYNKTTANVDSKSLDGNSYSLNNNIVNKNNYNNNLNDRNILLKDLLESKKLIFVFDS